MTWHVPIMLPNCLHDLAALGPDGLTALVIAMFLAGLGGGATHCAGMCGPFVIAQLTAGMASGPGLSRLAGAALLPYHAGRAVGYATLGAVAGGAAGALTSLLSRGLLAAPLAAAAIAMLAQGGARLPFPAWLRLPHLSPPLGRPVSRILRAPAGNGSRFLLGLALSAMPCGLLYGALAGATASGSALGGALAMLAFVAGTVPSLIGVALLGRLFGRRFGSGLRTASTVALLLNAAVLAGLALRVAGLA